MLCYSAGWRLTRARRTRASSGEGREVTKGRLWLNALWRPEQQNGKSQRHVCTTSVVRFLGVVWVVGRGVKDGGGRATSRDVREKCELVKEVVVGSKRKTIGKESQVWIGDASSSGKQKGNDW